MRPRRTQVLFVGEIHECHEDVFEIRKQLVGQLEIRFPTAQPEKAQWVAPARDDGMLYAAGRNG